MEQRTVEGGAMTCIPITEAGTPLERLDTLAPGVLGYAMMANGTLYVPMLEAVNEGSGDVGRFLDSLPALTRIPTVMSSRLAGMLHRRGWVFELEDITDEDSPFFGETAEFWVKR